MRGALLLVLAACASSPAPVQQLCAPWPVRPTSARPCLRPPPVEPPFIGDEAIDRHRRDWHRERLMAWAIASWQACQP